MEQQPEVSCEVAFLQISVSLRTGHMQKGTCSRAWEAESPRSWGFRGSAPGPGPGSAGPCQQLPCPHVALPAQVLTGPGLAGVAPVPPAASAPGHPSLHPSTFLAPWAELELAIGSQGRGWDEARPARRAHRLASKLTTGPQQREGRQMGLLGAQELPETPALASLLAAPDNTRNRFSLVLLECFWRAGKA